MATENPSPPHTVYGFGNFRLDASRHLLFEKGSQDPLPVTPKAIAALLLFIEHRGELLTKDELIADLWPGRVVEESNLTQLISVLRHVLGEEPGENRYLATVPGRGYRFIADAVLHPDAPEAPQDLSQAITPAPDARPRRRAFIVLAGGIGAVLLAYWSFTQRQPVDKTGEPAAVELPSRTVAVLPFENLSMEDANEYMAFGIAESVLHRLANVKELTVIARTSSFVFHDRTTDARDIGRKLNARYLVEGSLQHSGPELRVTAQLIDATTGSHVWSLRFDRTLEDIFAVEDEIAQGVTDALQVSLDEPAHPYARFGLEAYLLYLRGQALIATRRNDDAELAVERFEQAIEIEPEFAAAYAALAEAHWQSVLLEQTAGTGLGFMIRSERQRERVAAAAREAQPLLGRALQLDDTLAEAYVLRADLKAHDGDSAGAEADYRAALARNPSYAVGHERYALFLFNHGDDGNAMVEIDEAIRVDPLAPRNHFLRGAMHWAGAEISEAEMSFLKALALDADYHPALLRLGLIRWQRGQFVEAIRLGERALAVDPRAEWIRWPLAQFYLEVRDVDAARSVLLEAPETVPAYDWLAICLYEEHPQQAAELLRADPSFRYRVDLDIRAYAIRDAALVSGHFAQAREELLVLPSFVSRPDMELFTLVALAQVSLAMGDRDDAEKLARESLDGGSDYAGAAALTLLAQNDAALDMLEDTYANQDRKRWWYVFQRDAGFESLRADPRFQALAAKAEAHAAAERERLRQMRARGQVPSRPPNETKGPKGC